MKTPQKKLDNNKRWREENAAHHLEYHQKRRRNNPIKARRERKNYYDANLGKVRSWAREGYYNNIDKRLDTTLQRKYGITLNQYYTMIDNQKGCCAICNQSETSKNKSLAVDHDHKTGKVRGLLCSRCNIGIGNFKDNSDYLINAIGYLNG